MEEGLQFTRRDGVLIASRVIAVFFFAWTLDVVLYLPERVYSLVHHINDYSVMTGPGYWRNYYVLELIFAVVRGVSWLFLALVFYECGPRVRAWLSPGDEKGER